MDGIGGREEAFGLGKMFADPNLLGKLATNPRTQKHLADPAFVQKVCQKILHPASFHLIALVHRSNYSNKIPGWLTGL